MPRPKKINPLHKMLKEGIERGSWDLICYAYEQETGEKLEAPKNFQPVIHPEPQQGVFEQGGHAQSIVIPGGNQPTKPRGRIFGNGTNAFKDEVKDGKIVTAVGGKKVENFKNDIKIDQLLKSEQDIDYRQAYKTVAFPCEICNRTLHISAEQAKANMSSTNVDKETGEKKTIIMCDECASGRGGSVGPRIS